MRNVLAVVVALLVVGGGVTGCGNTTAFMASGTGAFIQTPFGTLAIGNVETSITDIDASDEIVTVSDTTFFEADASLGGELGEGGIVNLGKQREYKMTVEPVEVGQSWEDQ